MKAIFIVALFIVILVFNIKVFTGTYPYDWTITKSIILLIGGNLIILFIFMVAKKAFYRIDSKVLKQKTKYMKNISIGWVWLIIVIIGVITAFYWFSMRPEQIKKECYRQSMGGVNYDACIRQHGLE